jgi:pilus assembly protein Flp/PilA
MQMLLMLLTERYNTLKNDSEAGQGMVEYALILFLVSIVGIVLLTAIGVHVKDVFTAVNDALEGTPGT